MTVLSVRNRQRTRPVNTPLLRRLMLDLLHDLLGLRHFEIAVHLVAAPEMERLNAKFLGHSGSTDVITFDHSAMPELAGEASTSPPPERRLHGEIFICLDDAVAQARQFKTSWPEELVRYVVHGVLHLQGFSDLLPAGRRAMKTEEHRLLLLLGRRFALSGLAQLPKVRA